MNSRLTRIHGLFLLTTLATLFAAVVLATTSQALAEGAVKITEGDGKVIVHIDGQPFAEYVFRGHAKPIIYPKEVWGKRAKWVDYWGPINEKVVGIALFDHPSNPRHPTWWHARYYGLVTANPFGAHAFEKKPEGTGDMRIPSGESVMFRYRFLFHTGDFKQANIAGEFESFAKTKPT